MPLTEEERAEINRAITDSLIRFTDFMQENRGSPSDRAGRDLVNLYGARGIDLLEDFTRSDRARRTRGTSPQARLISEIVGEVGLLVTQPSERKKRRKQLSNFNKAIREGMSAVRKSKFMGKPGKITNPKAAFSRVTKLVSGLKKGRKPPKKGVGASVYRAVRRFL
jgi:hypothetical protein